MKVDSRFMLPAEILVALYGMVWAVIGGLESHYGIYKFLALRGDNLTWLVVVGGASSFAFVVSFLQLLAGRCWHQQSIYLSSVIRSAAALLMMLSWTYILRILSLRDDELNALDFLALVSLAYAGWSFYENGKVLHVIKHPESYHRLVLHR